MPHADRVQFTEDLDQLGCSCCNRPNHGEVYLHSRCHPAQPTWSSYRRGVLTISCAACGRVVCAVAVAPRA